MRIVDRERAQSLGQAQHVVGVASTLAHCRAYLSHHLLHRSRTQEVRIARGRHVHEYARFARWVRREEERKLDTLEAAALPDIEVR